MAPFPTPTTAPKRRPTPSLTLPTTTLLDSADATVTLTINPVNDAPIALDDSATVDEGGAVSVLDSTETSVLANDTDSENDSLTAILVTAPANGSVTLNPDGTFSYTHNGAETTTDSFTYRANDGSLDSADARVTITINPVNDPPVGSSLASETNEGTAIPITLSGTDLDNDPLTFTIVSGPFAGTLELVTPQDPITDPQCHLHPGSQLCRRRQLHLHRQRRHR